ncbi:MAG: hypothetical protein EZS28_049516, partial [Streblomastix strix]
QNYYTKAQTFSQTEANNKFVRFDGSIQQTVTGRLKYVSPFDYPDETQDPVANTYLTMSEVDAKLTTVVTTNTTQSITGAETFNSNVSATGFAKTGKDDTSVLLAGGVGSISNTITPPTLPSTTYPISLATKRKTLTCVYSYRDFKISTDSTEVWGINDDVDEALLDAAGLSDFPELYAYIHEREPKPIVDGIANQIIIGPQYLQDQVKDNDDKLNVQPIPQPIVPIETPQVQIFKIPKSQLAPNVQMYNPADEYFYFYKLRNKVVY